MPWSFGPTDSVVRIPEAHKISPFTKRFYTAGAEDMYRWTHLQPVYPPEQVGKDTWLYSCTISDGRRVSAIGRRGLSIEPIHLKCHNPSGAAVYSHERDFLMYMINGKFHRPTGEPAVIDLMNGHYEYWEDGLLHRLGGPAIEHTCSEGWQHSYFIEGKLHRVKGPAIEASNGVKIFALAGQIMTEVQHMLMTRPVTPELIDEAINAYKTNKDIRLIRNAMRKAGYSYKEAVRFQERFKLLKSFTK